MADTDSLERIRKALEAGPTPGEWMFQGTEPFTTSSGEFAQWGHFRISAGSLAMEDEAFYFIANVSNANDASQNKANAEWIAACNPVAIRSLLAREAALREALGMIAWSNDSKWQADCARAALASTEPTKD